MSSPPSAPPELWGIHDVDRFIYDEQERPLLLADTERWRALVVDMRTRPANELLLINRGFRWINEVPFNR